MRRSLGVRACLLACLVVLLVAVAGCGREAEPPPAPTPTAIPNTATIPLVGGAQTKSLTCESQSASDLARFWGKPITEMEFFNRLPRSDNPFRGFVGSPDAPAGSLPPVGYGVYAEPVADTLRSFGLNAEASQGKGVNWVRQEVAAGRPVLVWATYGFKSVPVKTYVPRDGQQVPIVQYEHTFLAVGYDASGIWVIDALDGQRKHIPYADFDRAWSLLGQMAVSVLPGEALTARGSSLMDSAGRALTIVTITLAALAVAALAWRTKQQPRRRRRMAQTAEYAVGRVVSSGSSPRRSARRETTWPQWPALRLPLPSLDRWLEWLQVRGARVRRDARPLLLRAAAWRFSQPLPLALVGIGVGMLVVAVLGWSNPCVSLPILAAGASVGFWLGVEIQAAHRDGDDVAQGG
ncbi:MAG: C39 family peptidase [Anaerolineae bacterium]